MHARLLLNLLILSYISLSYLPVFGWWYSSVGTALIIFFSYLLWNKLFLKNIGLLLNLKTVIQSLLLAAIVVVCSLFVMKYIAAKHHVTISYTNWREYYHDMFYVLNEEIVMGAIILLVLAPKRKIPPMIVSMGLATFFALIHFVFYKWIFLDRGTIEITTLLTLFFVGFVRNNLILQTGHIGYSWALHFGWMAVMFGSLHYAQDKNIRLGELVRFNTYLGSVQMLIISGILAGCSLYWMKKHMPMKDSNSMIE